MSSVSTNSPFWEEVHPAAAPEVRQGSQSLGHPPRRMLEGKAMVIGTTLLYHPRRDLPVGSVFFHSHAPPPPPPPL